MSSLPLLAFSFPAALAALLGAPAAAPARPRPAGIYYEQVTTVSAEGEPAGPGVHSRVWFAGRQVRLESGGEGAEAGGTALILRLDEGTAFRLDPAERTAERLDLEALRAQSRSDSALAGELMGAGEPGAVRTASLPAKTVAGYPCRGFRLRSGAAVVDVYTTTEVPVRMEAFAELLEWTGAAEALAGLWDEMRKLPGFPLETRARVDVLGDVQETVSTVTRVRVGAVPAAKFELPAGYRVR
ncbi:MAG TPA: DUF4412 domain-containing protein [Vicinamibacteria bacterium]|nr:DUF4412 domain-containing protein [Vicinamibacteria bacterium]